MREENPSQKSLRNSYRRGRGGREQGRGKRLQKRANGSKSAAAQRNSRINDNVNPGLRQLGKRTLKQGTGRGRRTVRKRRSGNKVVEETVQVHMADVHSSPESGGESPRNFGDEWDDEKVDLDHMKDDDNIIGEEAVESDDNAQEEEYEQRNWEVGYNGVASEWNGGLMEVSDEDADAFEDDDNGVEEVGEEDSEGDVEVSEGSDEMPNRIVNDEGSDLSASEDYSD